MFFHSYVQRRDGRRHVSQARLDRNYFSRRATILVGAFFVATLILSQYGIVLARPLLQVPGDIVINEIMQNPSNVNDSAGEWFEVANTTASGIDINGWTIKDDGTNSHVISNGGPLIVPAGGFLVLGRNADSATNGGVTVGYQYDTSVFLANGDDEIILLDGSLTEMDRVEYDGGPNFPDPNGASMALNDPANDNNIGANWSESTMAFGSGDLGTPGAPNNSGGGGTTLAIAPTDADKAEGDSGTTNFTFTVTRSGDTSGATDVDYAVTSSAADTTDFDGGVLPSGTANFAASDTTATIDIPVSGDMDPELDEDFTVTLSNPANGETLSTDAANGTIQNDDGVLLTLIHDIQGTADLNLLDGQIVTIEAIVIGDFQDGDGDTTRDLEGFYVQEEDGDADGNALTSEGIFIFEDAPTADDVNVGDLVQVTGTVDEGFGQTQIDAITDITVVSSGNTLPTAASVSLPASTRTSFGGDPEADLEAFEGMLVTFPDTLSITEMFNLDRFVEIRLSQGGRLEQFTQNNTPDATGFTAHLDSNASRTVTYEDGLNGSNSGPIGNLDGFGPTFSTATDIRMGDTIDNLSGVLTYGFSAWRVRATQNGENSFAKVNNRPALPDNVGGSIKVASFNVLNYFTTIDTGLDNSGPNDTLEPRGADDLTPFGVNPATAEFDRQAAKLVDAIIKMNADIVGLVELENDDDIAIADLVAKINAVAGVGTYAFVPTGDVGTDAITTGLIYKPGTVTLLGSAAILTFVEASAATTFNVASALNAFVSADDEVQNFPRNRPAVAATFQENANGRRIAVAVNHFKSKGDSNLEDTFLDASNDPAAPAEDIQALLDDPNYDQNDGAGFWNQVRTDAAGELAAWLDTDPTGQGAKNIMVIGDLNAYAMEQPVTTLEAAGYTDLAETFLGASASSFVFDGQQGTLDYALANSFLLPQISGVTEWHINADEPDAIDYNLDFGRDAAIFDGTVPFRASDHDPVIVGLEIPVSQIPNMSQSLVGFMYNGAAQDHGQYGELTIDFGFTYNSGAALENIYSLMTVVNNALVVNTDQGVAGVDSTITVKNVDLPGDNSLFDTGEQLVIKYVVAISNVPWTVNFDLYGTEAGVSAAGVGELLGSFTIDSSMFDLDITPQVEPAIFLPFIQ
ncbi:MAG: ExeM/NucH family extracellular endonuclease [Chloroflexota bacterium]